MSIADDVLALIRQEELIQFALEICNIDSPLGHEAEVGEYLYRWLLKEGFNARKIGLLSERFNVLGTLPGAGGGYSLIFNSHMDTAVPRDPDLVHLNYADRVYHSAWVEGDLIVGEGIVNDKGPMVSGVIGETSGEPLDDDAPGDFLESKEIGARFLITYGGVADYALVAEGTGFGLVWIEVGEFWYKVSLRSSQPPFYTPYLPERTTLARSPNMVVAAAAAIEAIEKWAADYQKRNTYRSAGGTVVPKVQIGGIRGGDAHRPVHSAQLCHLYLDVRSVPGQDPLRTKLEISRAVSEAGLEASVELYHFRPGYEAKNVEPFAAAVRRLLSSRPPACGAT